MKTKDLIKLLQEADPEGEIECCIGNVDIHFVEKLPAYYDGVLQVLARDHSKDPYYNICGGKYTSKGSKIKIYPLSITDAISNDVNLPIDYSEISEQRASDYKESDDKTRQANIDLDIKAEYSLFQNWAKEKAIAISGDTDGLIYVVYDFFIANISRTDPFPEDIAKLTHEDKQGNRWCLSIEQKRFGANYD